MSDSLESLRRKIDGAAEQLGDGAPCNLRDCLRVRVGTEMCPPNQAVIQ